MLLKLGDTGLAVKRLQEMLILIPAEGVDLKPDGDFGPITEKAVKSVQSFFNYIENNNILDVDGIVGNATLNKIYDYLGYTNDGYLQYEHNGVLVIDARGELPSPKNYLGYNRDWPTGIDSVVLHQTGCKMPQNIEFWGKVNAHIGVLRNGTVYFMQPWHYQIWHAQDLSKKSIGIEIEGNMRGIENNDKTFWKAGGGPHSLTDEQEQALNDAVFPLLKDAFDANNGSWNHVWAHRQSSSDRQADPGSKVWQKVGRVWMERLGLSESDLFVTTGSGMPIPKQWDDRSDKSYWG